MNLKGNLERLVPKTTIKILVGVYDKISSYSEKIPMMSEMEIEEIKKDISLNYMNTFPSV